MEPERRSVYRLCRKCWRSWNVSCLDPPEVDAYLCPLCRGEGQYAARQEEGGRPGWRSR